MPQSLRKAPVMYDHFGKCKGHTCGECQNLVIFTNRGKTYRKCKIYGVTRSEASDWTKRWDACGMFNQEYNERPIIEQRHASVNSELETQIEGQLSLV